MGFGAVGVAVGVGGGGGCGCQLHTAIVCMVGWGMISGFVDCIGDKG